MHIIKNHIDRKPVLLLLLLSDCCMYADGRLKRGSNFNKLLFAGEYRSAYDASGKKYPEGDRETWQWKAEGKGGRGKGGESGNSIK